MRAATCGTCGDLRRFRVLPIPTRCDMSPRSEQTSVPAKAVVALLCAAAVTVMLAMPGVALADQQEYSANLTTSSITATTHESSSELLFSPEDGITVDPGVAL